MCHHSIVTGKLTHGRRVSLQKASRKPKRANHRDTICSNQNWETRETTTLPSRGRPERTVQRPNEPVPLFLPGSVVGRNTRCCALNANLSVSDRIR